MENFNIAVRRAHLAFDLLVGLRIPPTPPRFTVAYIHHSGEDGGLSLEVSRLIGSDRLSGEAVDELYQQISGADTDRAKLSDASRKVQDTMVDVVDQVAISRRRHQGYGVHLQEFVEALTEHDKTDLQGKAKALLDETGEVAQDRRQLEDRLNAALHKLEVLRGQLGRLGREVRQDPLTGIGNRVIFNRQLRAAVTQAKRTAAPLTLLMVDIDNFKQFNDRHGHQMGDQVLKLVARQLATVAPDDNEPARYGGEEFVLLLKGCDLPQAKEIADRLRELVAGKRIVNRRTGETLGQVTLSIGVALYRAGEAPSDLMRRADEAMYLAKAAGRNCLMTSEQAGFEVALNC
jgi:diguanylate cyclase